MKNPFSSFPYQYHLRNLFSRKASTALNLMAIIVTVMTFLIMNGMALGLKSSLESTGRDLTVIVLTKGAQTAEVSKLPNDFYSVLRYYPELAKRSDGRPKIAEETYAVKPLYSQDGRNRPWIPIRGIDPKNIDLYANVFKITEGKDSLGDGEVLVGSLVPLKLGPIKIGDQIPLGRQRHRVIGFFSAKGSAYESELWVTRSDLKVDFNLDYASNLIAEFNSVEERNDFLQRASKDPRLRADIKTEREYFSSLAESANTLQWVARIIAVILSIAAIFTGMNALYSSVSSRTAEIGTLRSIGFSRKNLLLGFMFEGLCIAMIAGALSIIFSLPFQKLPIAYMRSSFRIVIPYTLAMKGLLVAFTVGFIGSLIPARQAARMKIVKALR